MICNKLGMNHWIADREIDEIVLLEFLAECIGVSMWKSCFH